MSNKFKVGDKVRCVRGHAGLLYTGEIYVVRGIDSIYSYVYLVGGALGHGWHTSRFELVSSAPATPPKPQASDFAVGSKVMVGDQSKYDGKWAGPMEVKATNSNFVTCKHPAYALTGAFYPTELVAYQEPPREFRLSRNGSIAGTAHKTPEEVAEYARKNLSDSVEFEIVEVVTVSKHTVRKVVEARA